MGLFDRFKGRKPDSSPDAPASPEPAASSEAPGSASSPAAASAGGAMPRLAQARTRLEARDLEGALVIYEEVLTSAGNRPDILVTISGDLGTFGHVREIIDVVAPRYDATLHGPATGLNLLQAYLTIRDPGSAQHVLDILFSLNRPELEERLYGFSNAIAELFATHSDQSSLNPGSGFEGEPTHIELVSFSRPIWFYGLEPLEAELFPARTEEARRIAFGQLGLPGVRNLADATQRPEDELGRLSRALPLWFAETFHFCPHYIVSAAVGLEASGSDKRPALFPVEWTSENVTQLVTTSGEDLDYVFTGTLQQVTGDYELMLRLWEVKRFRERKRFTARWTPGDANDALSRLHKELRTFMEWKPGTTGMKYEPPADPRPWLDVLGIAMGYFLSGKGLVPRDLLAPPVAVFSALEPYTSRSESASLAWLTLCEHVRTLDLGPLPATSNLVPSQLVTQARTLLGGS